MEPTQEQYIRQLEDAAHTLWSEINGEQIANLSIDCPRLLEFMAHLHHKVTHEEAMVRNNVWTD